MVKNLPANTGEGQRHRFHPWVRKIPWRRDWQSTSVFLPGKFHGKKSLVGYIPGSHKELDTTECLSTCISDLVVISRLKKTRVQMSEAFFLLH